MPMILAALVATQSPGAPLKVDLSGALTRAKAENALLKAAAARVEERRSLITTARADALPQLTAIGDFTRARDVSILNSGFADVAASQNIPINSLVGARSIYTTQLNLVQPIFAWGKLSGAVDVAKIGEAEARAAYTTAELDILHGVAKAYLGVLQAQAQLDVVKVKQETATKLLEDIQNKLEAQSATQLDLLRAQAELEGVAPEALQAQANFQRAQELLNGQLGLDPRTPLEVEQLPPAVVPADLRGVDRSELQQLNEQEKGYRINDQIITSDLRPRLDFSASAGYQAGKTDNLFKEPYDTWRVSLTLKVPIFDGLRTSGKRAQNRAVLEQIRQSKVDTERQIQVQQASARREVGKAQAFLEAATKAHDAGQEALRVSRESFAEGLISSLDLLQAERQERQLESQRVQAQLAVWSALLDLRRSLGLAPL
ncbi:MAG TPA: TolC family protein [Holophagaceae bacterium]|nr:TolC family protein [Holophagaceae bacterium]